MKALYNFHGTLLGGTTGMIIGGPLGALVGSALGQVYDRTRKGVMRALFTVEDAYDDIANIDTPAAHRHTPPSHAKEAAFTIGVIALGAKLARLNQRLDRDTIERFRAAFRLPPSDIPMIRKMFEQALFDAVGHKPYADQLAGLFSTRPDMLEALLQGLVRFAVIDRELTPAVIDYLDALALRFNISRARLDSLMQAEGVSRENIARDVPDMMQSAMSPFEVLGVPKGAPEIVVKQAYRTLIKECHPDLMQAGGNEALHIDAEALALANDRMAAINAAYSEIKKSRGWS